RPSWGHRPSSAPPDHAQGRVARGSGRATTAGAVWPGAESALAALLELAGGTGLHRPSSTSRPAKPGLRSARAARAPASPPAGDHERAWIGHRRLSPSGHAILIGPPPRARPMAAASPDHPTGGVISITIGA